MTVHRLADHPLDGTGRPLVGAFAGADADADSHLDAVGAWLGDPLDVQTLFAPWHADAAGRDWLTDRLTAIWNAGRVPLLTLEAFTPTPYATPADVVERALRGAYDDRLHATASALRDWLAGPDGVLGTDDDRRLLLRPLHEPNGDWYPWAPAAGGCTAGDYARLWRRLHALVMADGVTSRHVQWVWAVNHADVGGVSAEALYPGDSVVDWVGVDGFNWGATRSWSSWQPPADVFGEMLDRVASVADAPVCVPEFGCTSETADGPDVARKSTWLREAFAYFRERDVRLAASFDVQKETDWAAFGGERGDCRVDGQPAYCGFAAGVRTFRE